MNFIFKVNGENRPAIQRKHSGDVCCAAYRNGVAATDIRVHEQDSHCARIWELCQMKMAKQYKRGEHVVDQVDWANMEIGIVLQHGHGATQLPLPTQCSIAGINGNATKQCDPIGKLKGRRRQRSHQYAGFPCTLPLYYQCLLEQSLERNDSKDCLPLDPRCWTKCDVRRWLSEIGRHHEIDTGLDYAKFSFNGKSLCALTLEMFQCRAPLYGKLLYRDIRLRVAKAMAFM